MGKVKGNPVKLGPQPIETQRNRSLFSILEEDGQVVDVNTRYNHYEATPADGPESSPGSLGIIYRPGKKPMTYSWGPKNAPQNPVISKVLFNAF